MWQYNYTPSSDDIMHYGVLGMRWGHRKKYYTSSGSLNSLGKARKNYENAKEKRKQLGKENFKRNITSFGIKGIEKSQKSQSNYNKALANEVAAKAKYNSYKSKKSEKAEFNTYRKAMQKNGLPGSAYDQSRGGQSTAIYNKIKAQKGKEYVDKVQKKVQNRLISQLATGAAVTIGAGIVAGYMTLR